MVQLGKAEESLYCVGMLYLGKLVLCDWRKADIFE